MRILFIAIFFASIVGFLLSLAFLASAPLVGAALMVSCSILLGAFMISYMIEETRKPRKE